VRQRESNEEPTVVDFSLPDGNFGGVTVANKTPAFRVEEELYHVTETTKPFILGIGESQTIMQYKERGEVVAIDIVVDNPYVQVYLQLDDYKADEQGITAAQLLKIGRTEFAEGEFSAKALPSGDYLLTYAPRNAILYKDQIKLTVANRITKGSPYRSIGSDLNVGSNNFNVRGGGPQTSSLSFLGGSVLDLPHLAAETNSGRISASTARNIAWQSYTNKDNNQRLQDGNDAIAPGIKFNQEVITSHDHPASDLNMYQGRAGRLELGAETTALNYERVVFFPKGTAASTTVGAPPADPNYQHIMIFKADSATSSLEDESEIVSVKPAATLAGRSLYVRDKGRFYFPGTVESSFQYNSTTGTFIAAGSGDGAYIISVHPGLDFVPDKVTLYPVSTSQGLTQIGIIVHTGTDKQYAHSGVTIREVTVKRKKRRSLV
jgi:hypothetical protein